MSNAKSKLPSVQNLLHRTLIIRKSNKIRFLIVKLLGKQLLANITKLGYKNIRAQKCKIITNTSSSNGAYI